MRVNQRSIFFAVFASLRLCVIVTLPFAPSSLIAQTSAPNLDQQSLALRTALHHDPTLAAPLTGLVNLYRESNRVDELVNLYRRHLDEWPQDAGARIVLVRVLAAVGDPEAGPAAKAAAQRLPDVAYVQYLLYEQLELAADPTALDALDRAIRLEALPTRKRQWIELLLAKAAAQQRDDLLDAHLATLAALVADAPQNAAEAAAIMIRYKRFEPAMALLEGALQRQPAPELMVQLELAAADAQVGLNRAADAGRRLDALLGKVAHDYWRRDEILRRRVALVTDAADRKAMIDAARARLDARPDHVQAVLDLARLLEGFEQRREALAVLLDAGRRLPQSQPIEAATLDLFDILRDEAGRAEYLAARLLQQPDREDLADRYARSLFMLGRRDDAMALLAPRLAAMTDAARLNRLIETARFLRRAALTADAAPLLAQAVALAPARLDVRRELAEVYLALDRRPDAQALFSQPLPPDAAIENLLDLVGLLIDKEMYPQARAALRDRLPREPVNLEIRMLLLKVEAALASQRSGLELIDQARALADTAARYRSWLEGAAQFHDTFDSTEAFLTDELARLTQDTTDLTARSVERRMVFAEVTTRTKIVPAVTTMLQETLAAQLPDDVPAELRLKLRRHLIAALADTAGGGDPVQLSQQLRALAQDDPMARHEVDARMALLYARQNLTHEVAPLVASIDPAAIGDVALLQQLVELFANTGQAHRIGQLFERMIQIDPANRAAWEQWLASLAIGGDEERLRLAVRRLLAGIDRMPLSDDARAALARSLTDSYWRSIARLLTADATSGGEAASADALALLDAAQRIADSDAQAMWVAWCRAYVLNRQSRAAERDLVLDELARLAAQISPGDGPPRIVFPSGMSIAVDAARRMLTAPPAPAPMQTWPDRIGPTPRDGRLAMRWAFDSPARAAIIAIMPAGGGRVLIADAAGSLFCVDEATGKLHWDRAAAVPATPTQPLTVMLTNMHGQSYQTRTPPLAVPPVLDGDRLLTLDSGAVTCVAVSDGRVLWRSLTAASPAMLGNSNVVLPGPTLFIRDGRVLAYDATGDALFILDAQTGKLITEYSLAGASSQPVTSTGRAMAINSGAWLDDQRMLTYGSTACIFDLARGEAVWSFAPTDAGRFPLTLDAPSEQDGASAAAMIAARPSSTVVMHPTAVQSRATFFSGPVRSRSTLQHVNFLDVQAWRGYHVAPGARVWLTTPAITWADLSNNSGQPRRGLIVGDTLVLLSGSSALLLPIDLPLSARNLGISGMLVGTVGSRVCFLDATNLSVLDVRDGQLQHIPVADVRGDTPPGQTRLGVVLDGAIACVSGPGGIVGINIATARRVFHAPWPDATAQLPADSPAPMAHPHQHSVLYQLHGTTTLLPDRTGQYGPVLPPVDRVTAGGLLLTSPAMGRVVALASPEADE